MSEDQETSESKPPQVDHSSTIKTPSEPPPELASDEQRGVDTVPEPPSETHFDQILYDKDTTPIEKEVIPKLSQIKTKEKQEELSKFHSPELAEKLNLERVNDFVEKHTGNRPNCQVVVVPEENKQEFIEQNHLQGSENYAGGYIHEYDLIFVYIPQGIDDYTRYESTLVHELTHADAFKLGVVGPDNKPRQYVASKRSGMAVPDSDGYGSFFEELMPAHLQFLYLQENYTKEQFDQALKNARVSGATSINKLVKGFEINGSNSIDLPHKYFAMPENNKNMYSDSFHAAIYDEMEDLLKKKGHDFTQLLKDARQDPHKIKELAKSVDQVLGKGTYTRLQKTPTKVQDLVQVYDFVKHHHSKRPRFFPKFIWDRATRQ